MQALKKSTKKMKHLLVDLRGDELAQYRGLLQIDFSKSLNGSSVKLLFGAKSPLDGIQRIAAVVKTCSDAKNTQTIYTENGVQVIMHPKFDRLNALTIKNVLTGLIDFWCMSEQSALQPAREFSFPQPTRNENINNAGPRAVWRF